MTEEILTNEAILEALDPCESRIASIKQAVDEALEQTKTDKKTVEKELANLKQKNKQHSMNNALLDSANEKLVAENKLYLDLLKQNKIVVDPKKTDEIDQANKKRIENIKEIYKTSSTGLQAI